MISEDSEVYIYRNQINNLDDYLKFMRKQNIQKNVLFKRFVNLCKFNFINISENLPINLDPLLLITETEKQLKIFPYGKKWENFEIDIENFIKNNFLEKFKLYKEEQIKGELLAKEYLDKQYLNDNKGFFNHMQKLIKQMGQENLPESVFFKDIIRENFISFNVNYKIAKVSSESFNYESLQLNYWKDLFLKKTFSDEVEIRFQYVTGIEFGNVFYHCLSNPELFFHINRHSLVNRQNINRTMQQRTYNFMNEDIPFHQTKETKDSRMNKIWNFKVVQSTEKNMLDLKYIGNKDTFYKNSFSFYTRNKKHPLHFFILDMAVIKDKNDFKIKYKIELEKRPEIIYNESMLQNAIIYILKFMQDVRFDNELIDSAVKNNIFKIIKNPKIFVNKVLPFSTNQKSVLEFINSEYYATNKLDGERVILFIDTLLGVFIVYLDGSKKKILNPFTLEMNFNKQIFFDCELFNNTINIFDIIVVNTKFENRLKMLESYKPFLTDLFSKIKNYKFQIKEFFKINSMKDISIVYENMLYSNDLDGIILQPNDSNYKDSVPLKLKPPKLNTLDILVEETIGEPKNLVEEINSKLIHKCNFMKFNFNIYLFIVEVTFLNNAYYPLKVRFEKTYGNPEPILKSNIALSQISVNDIISGKGIILAKKIINEIKRSILNENKGVLVDVGSGQGGDIDKWNNFRKIFAIERDDTMINIFKERLKNSKADIKLIHSNFEDVNIKEMGIKNQNIDIMTIFFSVNSICKSKESLKAFVKKIKEINPKKIILLYNDYNDLKRIKSDFLKIKDVTEGVVESQVGPGKVPESRSNQISNGYIITIENTFVVDILEYEFIVSLFIDELGYFHKEEKLDLFYPNLSEFENNFLKTIRKIEFSKTFIDKIQVEEYDFDQVIGVEEKDVEVDFDDNLEIIGFDDEGVVSDETDEDESDVVIEYEFEIEKETTIPVINVSSLDVTDVKLEDLIQFWPVPSEFTNIFIKENELTFKKYIDFSNENLWILLDVFYKNIILNFNIKEKNISIKNLFEFDIYTTLDPFTFLFQNILGKKLKFLGYSLRDILYNPKLMNLNPAVSLHPAGPEARGQSPPLHPAGASEKIFIGKIEDIPEGWNDSILVIVDKITKEKLEILSRYNDIIVYRTFLIPGIVYECHNKTFNLNINKIFGILEDTNKLNLLNLQKPTIMPVEIQLIKIIDLNFENTSFNIRCIYNLLINSNADKYFFDREDLKQIYKTNAKNKISWDPNDELEIEMKYLKLKMNINLIQLNHGMFLSKAIINLTDDYFAIYNKNDLLNKYLIPTELQIDLGKNIFLVTDKYIEQIQESKLSENSLEQNKNVEPSLPDVYYYYNTYLQKYYKIKENNILDKIKLDFKESNSKKYFFEQFFKDDNLNKKWYSDIQTTSPETFDLSVYKLVGYVINNSTDLSKRNLYFKRFNNFYKYTLESEIIKIDKFDFSEIPYLAFYQK